MKIRPVMLMAFAVAMALLLSCSKSAPSPQPDTLNPGGEAGGDIGGGGYAQESPEVRFYPPDGRVNVAAGTNIELYFSVDMDLEGDWSVTVDGMNYDRYTLAGVTWQQRALTISPAEPFEQGSTVYVNASGFVSAAGVPMESGTISFTVVQYGVPTLVITPSGTGVNPSSDVTLEFNMPVLPDNDWTVTVDARTYTKGSSGKSWDETGKVLTISPPNPPRYFTPGAMVSVNAQGFVTAYGSLVVPETSGSFTVDDNLPSITIIPNGTSAPVSIAAPLRLLFDKPVDQDCGWTVVLDGVSYTQASAGDIEWKSDNLELSINHAVSDPFLTRGTVGAAASDFFAADRYPFDAASITFAVKSEPAVQSTPADGQGDVPIDSSILLSFDDPVMDAAGWEVVVKNEDDTKTYAFSTSWNASRTILTVDPTEDFQPRKMIRVTAKGFLAVDGVTIKDLDAVFQARVIEVSGVSLNKESTTVYMTMSEKLAATVSPSNASYPGVEWTSTHPEVATVDQDGLVIPVSVGATEIRAASTDNPSMYDICSVTVEITAFPVTGVTLDRKCATIRKGESLQLTASVAPANATVPGVIWSTSDPNVATVDQNGLVTAVEYGRADITVTTVDGGHTATCSVTVPNAGHIAVYHDETIDILPGGSYVFPGLTRVGMSKDATFKVVNEGIGTLVISGVDSTDETRFTVNDAGMNTVLAPGASTEFTVTFKPDSSPLTDADITIMSDDPDLNEFLFEVSGSRNTIQPNCTFSLNDTSGIGTTYGAPVNTPIVLTFTEPMNTGGWSVKIKDNYYYSGTWSDGNTKLTITPSGLPRACIIPVELSNFTAQADGAPLQGTTSFSYTTLWNVDFTIKVARYYGNEVCADDDGTAGNSELFWHINVAYMGENHPIAYQHYKCYTTLNNHGYIYNPNPGPHNSGCNCSQYITPPFCLPGDDTLSYSTFPVERDNNQAMTLGVVLADDDSSGEDDYIANWAGFTINYDADNDRFTCYKAWAGSNPDWDTAYSEINDTPAWWIIPVDAVGQEYHASFVLGGIARIVVTFEITSTPVEPVIP